MITPDMGEGRLLAGDRMDYRLSRQLAEGGEGIVYRLADREDVLAKVYKRWEPGRAEKLAYLLRVSEPRLREVAAWPLSQLRDETDEVIGLVMEDLSGWASLYSVYQIKSRLASAPHRSYEFLVRVSRNLATCVHRVHEAGIVVGDLNESNVLVSPSAMVKLIDVDSFHVRVNGELHPCQVGKAELTPPELQGLSLHQRERTSNHDNFGLAVLIFQCLVFGRHPFAGRPKEGFEGLTLEEAIVGGDYPFGARATRLDTPPYLNINWLPSEIRELFDRAFDPSVAARPTALEWFEALRELEGRLTTCQFNPSHVHWSGATPCPWCELENRWNIPLFIPKLGDVSFEADFDLQSVWEGIFSVPDVRPRWSSIKRTHKEFEPGTLPHWVRVLTKTMPMIVCFTFAALYIWMINRSTISRSMSTVINMMIVVVGPSISKNLVTLSVKTLIFIRIWIAEMRMRYLVEPRLGQALEEHTKFLLESCQNDYQRLQEPLVDLENARQKLIRVRYQDQLDIHLRKYSILGADAGPIGSQKLSDIYQRGFRTAADLTPQWVDGEKDRKAACWDQLMEWRRSLEEQFWSTAHYALPALEESRLHLRLQREHRECRERLVGAEKTLRSTAANLLLLDKEFQSKVEAPQRVLSKYGPLLLALKSTNQIQPKQ